MGHMAMLASQTLSGRIYPDRQFRPTVATLTGDRQIHLRGSNARRSVDATAQIDAYRAPGDGWGTRVRRSAHLTCSMACQDYHGGRVSRRVVVHHFFA